MILNTVKGMNDSMNKEKLVILDGNSIMNRTFYALPPLTNSEGLHTNAVYGFLTMLFKMKDEVSPDYIVCTFDKKTPTFRHEKYKEYKAGRKKMPPELSEQFPVLKEILNMLAINIFEIDGFEADDLIGTISAFAEEKGMQVYIVTGDRDALQLASDDTKVVITKKGISEKEIYDKKRMKDDFGITPQQFIDVKGLMGDTSDNIPGVPGIGEKTAFKLIREYGSIENVLMNMQNMNKSKIKENLENYSEQAIFSKKLSTIVRNVPIDINIDDIKSKTSYDYEALKKTFFKLQFKSLVERIKPDKNEEENTKEVNDDIQYTLIDNTKDAQKLNAIISKAQKEFIYVISAVENYGTYSKVKLEKLFLHFEGKSYAVYVDKIYEDNAQIAISFLNSIFNNDNITIVIHDAKSTMEVLGKIGIKLKKIGFDTALAAYLIDSSRGKYEIKTLIQEYLGKDIKSDDDSSLAKEAVLLEELYSILKEKIKELDMEKLLYEVEQPLTEVLADMENEGFRVDSKKLTELGEKFKSEIINTEKSIYDLAGEEFNINSPKQLGKILFEKLDLPVIKKTKTGYSTNAEVLEELSDKHPIIDKIMYYRQLAKLYSTYVEGLKTVIDTDGKIHSNFNQMVTTTGRLSSAEPNLQNIPVKYEMGKEIRKVFIPDSKDCMILSADYSQIELRVLAHIADDENMIDAFKNHADIHAKTASEVFKVPLSDVTHEMRSSAKAVNFGIVYGIGEFSLAKDLKIPRKEAKKYIDTYFERYPKIKLYMDNIVKQAKENGYVTTIMNRRRLIPEIKGPNKMVKALGERLAMNTPIQGSAADIIKLAMVNVFKELHEKNLKSSLILQVHDELILNVYKDEYDKVVDIVKRNMEQVVKLKVPMEVDINTGDTWYDAK